MSESVFNVLFICTGNSARSILGEALMNHLGQGRFRGFSAGSMPRGTVNPFTLETLAHLGLPLTGYRSKSWEEFTRPDAPPMDFVFTVCDQAAGEACPVWPGQPVTAHWGLADPAAVEGDDEAKRAAFRDTSIQLSHRIELLVSLPHNALDRKSLQHAVGEIGRHAP